MPPNQLQPERPSEVTLAIYFVNLDASAESDSFAPLNASVTCLGAI